MNAKLMITPIHLTFCAPSEKLCGQWRRKLRSDPLLSQLEVREGEDVNAEEGGKLESVFGWSVHQGFMADLFVSQNRDGGPIFDCIVSPANS